MPQKVSKKNDKKNCDTEPGSQIPGRSIARDTHLGKHDPRSVSILLTFCVYTESCSNGGTFELHRVRRTLVFRLNRRNCVVFGLEIAKTTYLSTH